MNALLALWKSEPARVVGFVTALVAVLAAFGLPITDDQQVKLIAAVAAALFLLGSAEVTRSAVYSPRTHTDEVGAAYNAGHADGVETAAVRNGQP